MTTGIYFKGLVFERTILLKLCPFKAVCVSSGHYRGVEKDPLLKPWSGDVIVFDPFDSLWLANYFLGDTDDSLNFGVRTLEEIRLRKALKASMRRAGEFILPLTSQIHLLLPFVLLCCKWCVSLSTVLCQVIQFLARAQISGTMVPAERRRTWDPSSVHLSLQPRMVRIIEHWALCID